MGKSSAWYRRQNLSVGKYEFDKVLCITKESVEEGKDPFVAPVGSCEKGNSPYGVADMAGNVWEWTSSFEDKYSVLKGGSF